MNIALTDDLPEERNKIQGIIMDYAAVKRVRIDVSSFASAEELLRDYRPLRYTAVFLDIFMNGMSGIDAARRIKEADRDALIVFLTTSNEHMPDAWRLHVFEYVEKPISKEKIFPALDDILDRIAPVSVPRFSFFSRGMERSVPYDDLVMVGTDTPNYLEVTDRSGETLHTRMTFAEASDILLKDKRFLLIRRGVIVNMAFIQNFDNSLCFLSAASPIPISPRSRKKLEQLWNNYLINRMQTNYPGGGSGV
ncbi:MAG: response regulator transcription factor [Oscillibacter sp.]|nr:response regulator transcription factor [Oscillibacter sp.]